MTVQNTHRRNIMCRGATLFSTARPHKEYNDFVEIFIEPMRAAHRRRRQAADFSYFRPILRRDQNSIQSQIIRTNPTIFITEFRRMRRLFGKYLGDKRLINFIKGHYKGRCQHAEWGSYQCPNCGEPVDKWDDDTVNTVRYETIDAVAEWQTFQLVNCHEEWFTEPISDGDINRETILVNTIEDDTFIDSGRALLNNVEITRFLREMFDY